MVKSKLEERIQRCKKRPTVLGARIVLANHLINSALWYLLTLWGGRPEELVEMQRQVINFIWDGHHSERRRYRVDATTICRPKEEGGLGLIYIPAQRRALAGRFFLWLLQDHKDNNPLRKLLQHYVRDHSYQRWGERNLTWIFMEGHPKSKLGSQVWRNMCACWKVNKEQLKPKAPAHLEEWLGLP
jgi:hypothetical protein